MRRGYNLDASLVERMEQELLGLPGTRCTLHSLFDLKASDLG